MHDPNDFQNPLSARYASTEMRYVFSPANKFGTWRRLWIALARAQRDLGLDITESQIAELEAMAETIDYDAASAYEATSASSDGA